MSPVEFAEEIPKGKLDRHGFARYRFQARQLANRGGTTEGSSFVLMDMTVF